MKILKIGRWFVFTLVGIYCVFEAVVAVLAHDNKLTFMRGQFLQFENQRLASRFSDLPILVGPSNVAQIGCSKAFINLGYPGASCREIELLLADIQPKSAIYGMSPYFETNWNRPKSGYPFNGFIRCRFVLQNLFRKSDRAPNITKSDLVGSFVRQISQIPDEEFAHLAEYFCEIQTQYPFTIFVLLPILREPTIDSKMQILRDSLIRNGMRFVDLSTALEQDDFLDALHYDESGLNKLRYLIIQLLQKPSAHGHLDICPSRIARETFNYPVRIAGDNYGLPIRNVRHLHLNHLLSDIV